MNAPNGPKGPQPPFSGSDESDETPAMAEWILEAGTRILEEDGPAGLTVQRLAERAGVAVGSLYRYFKSKDAIIEAVYRRQLDDALQQLESRQEEIADLPMEESVRVSMRHGVERHRRMRRLHPRFFQDNAARLSLSSYNPESAARARQIAFDAIERRRDELREDIDLDMASFLVLEGALAILRAAVESRPDLLERPEFAEELVRLFTRYLIKEPSGPEER